jgi:hypothetical protein
VGGREYGSFLLAEYIDRHRTQVAATRIVGSWTGIGNGVAPVEAARNALAPGQDATELARFWASSYILAPGAPFLTAGFDHPDTDLWREFLDGTESTGPDDFGAARPRRTSAGQLTSGGTVLADARVGAGGAAFFDYEVEEGKRHLEVTSTGDRGIGYAEESLRVVAMGFSTYPTLCAEPVVAEPTAGGVVVLEIDLPGSCTGLSVAVVNGNLPSHTVRSGQRDVAFAVRDLGPQAEMVVGGFDGTLRSFANDGQQVDVTSPLGGTVGGLAVLNDGRVIAGDVSASRVVRLSDTGGIETTLASGVTDPSDMELTPGGSVMFASGFSRSRTLVDPLGGASTSFTLPPLPNDEDSDVVSASMQVGDCRVMYSTMQGDAYDLGRLHRHDRCAGTTSYDVAALPRVAAVVASLAPGGTLVGSPGAIYQLNASGSVIRTYALQNPPPGANLRRWLQNDAPWYFDLAVLPDGSGFWALSSNGTASRFEFGSSAPVQQASVTGASIAATP